MPIKKFVLIKCENSNREEIIRSKKIYVQTPVAGSFNYTQLTELEYIDGNNQFVLFNQQKKAIKVAILANEDTEEALLPLCCNEKRPTRRKNFSESPVATKMSKRVVNKTEQDDCNEEKKRLSLAKNSVIESSDGLYLSDTDESDEENNRAGTCHQELSMVVNPVSSKLRGKKSTISIGQKKDKSEVCINFNNNNNLREYFLAHKGISPVTCQKVT